ncbi:MAG TPA: hypothetical protein PKE49_10440 [Leptospiraceae bacterium]|jgi:hypothetical protein|nr:hypothetical protein [Leptospirales bacterium]HMU83004.1 hypothetical protein [Leptospiraceae bacterium]HMX56932.1 hypothetical protein [Leptospiraceae bacterium]HMY44832.1 hypothetical protein [Leptospiraceae bacterium]HMZ36547.1 hypothetical protein [Leptospiraceae bacterium]
MDPFTANKYYAKKKLLKLFGGEVRIYDESRTNLLFFVKQKAFKLKEDITVFADESQSRPLLKIQARSILDFGTTYDVTDVVTNQKVGAIRRKLLKSILRDEWAILDASDKEFGTVSEDSMLMALLRRFLSNLIPQHFAMTVGGTQVGDLKQTWNPFVPQFNVDFSMDSGRLDRRLGIAAVVLLQVIEGKQSSMD